MIHACRSLLESDSVFLLDTGSSAPGLFIWVGQDAPSEHKKNAMMIAQDVLQHMGRPDNTSISRCFQGGETAIFKTFFSSFMAIPGQKKSEVVSHGVAHMKPSEVNVKALNQRRASTHAHGEIASRNKELETIDIYRIDHFDAIKVDEQEYGCFFEGDW